MAHAVHAGAKDAGIELESAVVNEIDSDLMAVSRRNNRIWGPSTRGLNMPMQELVQDTWILERLPRVEILEGGIPCSGSSRAGTTKRKLPVPEAHPEVGHLIAPTIMMVREMQPAIFFIENVVGMKTAGGAFILRNMLRDMGYNCAEVTLDSHDFGCLEARERWFLVAVTNGLDIDLSGLAPDSVSRPTIADITDDVADDDERWRTFGYLKTKAERDQAEGKGFKMQVFEATDTKISTLRKFYHKGGSTDPLLRHPRQEGLLRLLTGDEHARCKQVPPELVQGCTDVEKHQILGQSVAYEVVRALMKRVLTCVKNACEREGPTHGELVQGTTGYSLKGVG